jgi:hypothetical protein
MKRTQRPVELVAEGRSGSPVPAGHTPRSRLTVAGQRRRSRNWAMNIGFEIDADGRIAEQAITAHNQRHP